MGNGMRWDEMGWNDIRIHMTLTHEKRKLQRAYSIETIPFILLLLLLLAVQKMERLGFWFEYTAHLFCLFIPHTKEITTNINSKRIPKKKRITPFPSELSVKTFGEFGFSLFLPLKMTFMAVIFRIFSELRIGKKSRRRNFRSISLFAFAIYGQVIAFQKWI